MNRTNLGKSLTFLFSLPSLYRCDDGTHHSAQLTNDTGFLWNQKSTASAAKRPSDGFLLCGETLGVTLSLKETPQYYSTIHVMF